MAISRLTADEIARLDACQQLVAIVEQLRLARVSRAHAADLIETIARELEPK